MLKREILKRLLGIILALAALVFAYMFFTGFRYRIHISYPAGFYDKDIEIEASIFQNGDIYYTLDGTEPAPDKAGSEHYEMPIRLDARAQESVTTIKWKAYFDNGNSSKTVTNTYVVGKNVEDRFSTYMVSISTDPDNLYGYENGIFVEGKVRDDYIKENPHEAIDPLTPANYTVRGSVSERAVYVEMFEKDGTRIIAQDCGIRTGGDFSRASEQKPFRLFAREELYGLNEFSYDFFDIEKEESALISGYTGFSTLYFRNSGNDRQEAYIRDEVAQTMAKKAGFLDTQYFVPVSVYINGEYAGFYWMHSQYNQSYFKQRYGKYDGDMVVIGDGEKNMDTVTEDILVNHYAAEYMEQYQYFAKQDLTDEQIYDKLNAFIDIENYLQYYALQIYMGNQDWPYCNLQAYRYVSRKKNYTEGTVFDGRYRYLLYDVDTSMGRGCIRENMDPWVSVNKLQNLLDSEDAPLFKALMKRTDCQQYFTQYMCYLIDEVYTPENVAAAVDTIDASRRQEIDYYIEDMWGDKPGEYQYLDMQLDAIKAWSEVNGDSMKFKLQELWGFVL